jgi:hypothetical protein
MRLRAQYPGDFSLLPFTAEAVLASNYSTGANAPTSLLPTHAAYYRRR